MTIICGIDEAGRGPVIGPLVIAGVTIKKEDESKLAVLGVTDSKLLPPKKREEMFDELKNTVQKFEILIVPAEEIDQAVLSQTLNLNWLEAEKSCIILNRLLPEKAYIDCPSTNIPEYELYIKKKLNKEMQLFVQHKADLNHLVCGAASILAKVTRDREIEKLKQEFNVNFGSGYSSDPLTQNFIKEHYNSYPFFRKSWDTYKNAVINKQQKRLNQF